LLDSDHGLGEVIDEIIEQADDFLQPWLGTSD